MRVSSVSYIRLIFGAALIANTAGAAPTWPGCKDLADADFKATPIVTRAADTASEPLKMAFDLVAAPGEDAKDKVDVYFVERYGKLRKYDARKGKVLTVATFTNLPSASILSKSSDGLIGLALDPNFKTNHWIYLYYSYVVTGESTWRLSRFTLDEANEKMDFASEKIVLKIPMAVGSLHASGAMEFDAYGDLWVTVSNDMIDEVGNHPYPVWSSGNTNDLRGKILRIHPKPDGTYSIPDGNLFKPGTPKTLPEIYVMGLRNPYTISVDPVRRWLVWGDVGPNGLKNADGSGALIEEGNLATTPGNFGYPFFAGANFAIDKTINPAKPIIPANADWNNTVHGLDTLPPAIPAIRAYKEGCVMNGSIYRYDGDLNSSIKFPPHFHRKWFMTDFTANEKNPLIALTVSDDGKKLLAEDTVLKSISLYKPLEIKAGPDGAIYVVNYAGYRTVTANTGLIRIEYNGDCRPTEPKLETPTSIGPKRGKAGAEGAAIGGPKFSVAQARGIAVDVTTPGAFSLIVKDAAGKTVATASGQGNSRVTLDEIHKPGVYFLRITAAEGDASGRIVKQ